ncbi:MAG: ABC-F family ATP-binding cassette domain-containing protein [Bernardetiaceae bacterium]|nr:ABC-F family ATP-binding cassette domain-containing protein [Bernardetiaceae bacterium]
MLTIRDLSFYFADRALYEEASLQIKPKEHIGFVGPNGAGKSTLLRLIVGEYIPDGGAIEKSNDCSIGFLNQDLLSYESEESILEVAMQAFERENAIQRKINQILKTIETDPSDSNLNKLAALQAEFETLGGYAIQSKAEAMLEGLGFKTADLNRQLKEFSGGWRMRVMLAKLLLQKPALLLLDEPTNHLDLPSIEWVESYLRSYEGAYLVVSHDRDFLNNVSDIIVEASGRQLHRYAGNYDFYIEEKELREEILQKSFENQQQKIRETERFIDRFRAKATKSKQVQSRVKALERMDKIQMDTVAPQAMNLRFKAGQPSGKIVLKVKDLYKSYGDLKIFEDAVLEIERGDKIALIGANGKGKSTLLRIIDGSEAHEGEREGGYNVRKTFFAQHQLEALDLTNDLIEELRTVGANKNETELRTLLGCFLFTGEDVEKKIKVLSGGEKSRVALAKTLLTESNFLLLDEPTNHLDIMSVDILIEALQAYEGSFVVVSHNRYFVSEVANKICWIEDGQIKSYPGTYKEFSLWMQDREAERKQQAQTVKNEKPKANNKKKISDNSQEFKKKQKELQQARRKVEQIEDEIQKLEAQIADTEKQLAKPEVIADLKKLEQTNQQYQKLKATLAQYTENWEVALEEHEALETSF